jgi:cytochrome c551/c552
MRIGKAACTGCHYIDWNAVGVSLPKVLGLSDLDAVLASGALFARKFEGDGSRALRDQVERLLAEQERSGGPAPWTPMRPAVTDRS